MTPVTLQRAQTRRLLHGLRRSGDTDGLPMLLLHGSYASSRWWEPLMSVLPPAILAVAPDLRGCGDSQRTDHGYAIEEQSVDVAALVEYLGWSQFDLVAHSSSGAIAVEYVLTHPSAVRTLTLVDTVPAEGVFTPVETFMLLERMRTDHDLLAQALAALMPTFVGPDALPSDDDLAFFRLLVADAAGMAPAAVVAVAEGLAHWNRFADVGRLTLPALLVWGDLDVVVDRDTTTRTLIAIPGATNLDVLHHVGHSPMIEAPVTLAERIIDFISDDLDDYAAARQSGFDG